MPQIFRPISMTAQAAWNDLLRLLRDATVANLRGTPKLKKVRDRSYWFDQYRVGEKVVEKYLGEATEELTARMQAIRDLKGSQQENERERARLVRLLRAEGLLTPDVGTGQLLTAMSRAGTFRLGGTVVGTQAFRHFEGILGISLGLDQAAHTADIDVASFERLSIALSEAGHQVEPSMESVMSGLEFEAIPSLDNSRVWRWQQTRQQTLVEFLTPSFEEEETMKDLPALGVSAQSLHFLNYLIGDPVDVPVLYRTGALIKVPRPERYAIHKLIVAERRRDGVEATKSRKDRAQAEFLICILAETDPHLLIETFDSAIERGRSWESKVGASLARLPKAAEALRKARREVG